MQDSTPLTATGKEKKSALGTVAVRITARGAGEQQPVGSEAGPRSLCAGPDEMVPVTWP